MSENTYNDMCKRIDLLEMGEYVSDEEREDSVEFDDVLHIKYTSGTMFYPKGVTYYRKGVTYYSIQC